MLPYEIRTSNRHRPTDGATCNRDSIPAEPNGWTSTHRTAHTMPGIYSAVTKLCLLGQAIWIGNDTVHFPTSSIRCVHFFTYRIAFVYLSALYTMGFIPSRFARNCANIFVRCQSQQPTAVPNASFYRPPSNLQPSAMTGSKIRRPDFFWVPTVTRYANSLGT